MSSVPGRLTYARGTHAVSSGDAIYDQAIWHAFRRMDTISDWTGLAAPFHVCNQKQQNPKIVQHPLDHCVGRKRV